MAPEGLGNLLGSFGGFLEKSLEEDFGTVLEVLAREDAERFLG